MSLQLDLNTDRELLLAIVTGTLSSFAADWQVLKQIWDTALDNHLKRILVDALAVQGIAKTIDRYTMGVKLVAYCGEHKWWPMLAFVGEPPVVNGFGALVARNRGMDTEVFSNRKDALAWLYAAPSETAALTSDSARFAA